MKTIYSICARTGFFFTFLLLTTSLMAQNIQVKGLVKDPAGEAIIGPAAFRAWKACTNRRCCSAV